MPTENRSSNTEMVSVPRELADRIQLRLDHAASAFKAAKPERDQFRAILAKPAPQPHAEPIAWMVGTAIWWTKEEADRDAAATGLPIVGLGPMTGATEVERLRVELGYLREERDDLSARLDRFYSRSHGIKHLSAIEQLNDKLAERDTLLRELLADDVPLRLAAKIETALSASAEPSATKCKHPVKCARFENGEIVDHICQDCLQVFKPSAPVLKRHHDVTMFQRGEAKP